MLPVLLPAALLLAPLQPGLTKARFEEGLAENARYNRRYFTEAGLPPIEAVAASGRKIRRLWLSVWLPGDPPVMEIERRANGSTTLTLAWKGRAPQRYKVQSAVWTQVTAFDDDIFRKPDFATYRPVLTGTSCHGDMAAFDAADARRVRSAGAWECRGGLETFNDAKLAAVAVFVRAAIATQPKCAPLAAEDKPSNAFVRCFR